MKRMTKKLTLKKQTLNDLTLQTQVRGADSGNSGCYSWCDTCPPCGSFTCSKPKMMVWD
jgi:hypothetical protein